MTEQNFIPDPVAGPFDFDGWQHDPFAGWWRYGRSGTFSVIGAVIKSVTLYVDAITSARVETSSTVANVPVASGANQLIEIRDQEPTDWITVTVNNGDWICVQAIEWVAAESGEPPDDPPPDVPEDADLPVEREAPIYCDGTWSINAGVASHAGIEFRFDPAQQFEPAPFLGADQWTDNAVYLMDSVQQGATAAGGHIGLVAFREGLAFAWYDGQPRSILLPGTRYVVEDGKFHSVEVRRNHGLWRVYVDEIEVIVVEGDPAPAPLILLREKWKYDYAGVEYRPFRGWIQALDVGYWYTESNAGGMYAGP